MTKKPPSFETIVTALLLEAIDINIRQVIDMVNKGRNDEAVERLTVISRELNISLDTLAMTLPPPPPPTGDSSFNRLLKKTQPASDHTAAGDEDDDKIIH